MRGIIRDCFDELLDRKVIYVFGAVTLIAALGSIASFILESKLQDMMAVASQVEGSIILRAFNWHMYILVFLSVMATAGLIPDMLARGRADFYLSKPLSRARLLLTKVFGTWIVYGSLMVASFMANYFLSSALNGIFDFRFLYIVIINLLAFLIWLSVTSFAAILTRSTAISMMTAFLVWIAQWVLQYHDFVKEITDSKILIYIVDALYYIFPKASELSSMTNAVIAGGVESWLPLYSSLLFAVALMTVTVVIFNRKSY